MRKRRGAKRMEKGKEANETVSTVSTYEGKEKVSTFSMNLDGRRTQNSGNEQL